MLLLSTFITINPFFVELSKTENWKAVQKIIRNLKNFITTLSRIEYRQGF